VGIHKPSVQKHSSMISVVISTTVTKIYKIRITKRTCSSWSLPSHRVSVAQNYSSATSDFPSIHTRVPLPDQYFGIYSTDFSNFFPSRTVGTGTNLGNENVCRNTGAGKSMQHAVQTFAPAYLPMLHRTAVVHALRAALKQLS